MFQASTSDRCLDKEYAAIASEALSEEVIKSYVYLDT